MFEKFVRTGIESRDLLTAEFSKDKLVTQLSAKFEDYGMYVLAALINARISQLTTQETMVAQTKLNKNYLIEQHKHIRHLFNAGITYFFEDPLHLVSKEEANFNYFSKSEYLVK